MDCSHCGYLDVPIIAEEVPLCPGCGREAADADPEAWLQQWPAPRRSFLAKLFYRAVRTGCDDPPRVVAWVRADVARRLEGSTTSSHDPLFLDVHHTLTTPPASAEAYAALVLYNEHLPRDERQRQKREHAKNYVQQAMQGKPPTDAQLRYLHRLGYRGSPPTDRAHASALIDRHIKTEPGDPHV